MNLSAEKCYEKVVNCEIFFFQLLAKTRKILYNITNIFFVFVNIRRNHD